MKYESRLKNKSLEALLIELENNSEYARCEIDCFASKANESRLCLEPDMFEEAYKRLEKHHLESLEVLEDERIEILEAINSK